MKGLNSQATEGSTFIIFEMRLSSECYAIPLLACAIFKFPPFSNIVQLTPP